MKVWNCGILQACTGLYMVRRIRQFRAILADGMYVWGMSVYI